MYHIFFIWKDLLKTQLQCQLDGNNLQTWDNFSQKAVFFLNQFPIYGAVSPITRIRGFRKKGVEMGVAPLTVTSSDPLAILLLPVPMILYFAGLEVLVPEGGMFPPGDIKLRLPLGYLGLLRSLNL